MQKIIIKENAIFIADAHENENRHGFWEFLQALKDKKIQTPQLFLMGDIFDLLIYEVKATHGFAKAYIDLLEELADEIEIIYLEGNHDFNLAKFFKKVKVFSIKQQPLLCEFQDKTLVKLAHGDIFLKPFLQFCLKSLRNHYLLFFLNFLNIINKEKITQKILKNQNKKQLIRKIPHFSTLVKERLKHYNIGFVIEGHYHQDVFLEYENIKYLNLATFAYKESFFVVKYEPEIRFHKIELKEA
ncbi:UDP-2,3-diacylglucosamine diphosphatase [Campylobacter lari]|uniref:UDP-2,3-diacylglucosamine diphosphatase n=1 Tax=Campylobacter lari TaxID=201 RepID=UPI0012732D99|nr:metallophosphoesterase [Campylobacter lari]ECK1947371.1 UDP-2,3-diacylglucosamine diphosphatase [Campylobacter lari]ECK1948592.1 UDP-2,3-diacylglucosamine diphosphatase [Campylobacter lari]MBT0818843.1 metallophosphoesterase [Campylobacter lari]MBT0819689.1 metallophosphoesterase [Campylobacter lari]MBT0833187.1 metallophosphoesterase [Campylobacter lari]